nr:hypothetical protein [Tanacetum cinerariifolium]
VLKAVADKKVRAARQAHGVVRPARPPHAAALPGPRLRAGLAERRRVGGHHGVFDEPRPAQPRGAARRGCRRGVAGAAKPTVTLPTPALFELPEKVLQFGTGVLLRGLPDFLIDQANRQGIFNGRVVVVKSTDDGGDAAAFDRQNNLYTVCIRGVEDGQAVSEDVVSASISRVLSAKSQWAEVLKVATSPDLEVVLSNTTEVGIVLDENEDLGAAPPRSFPGKLLAVLHARFQAFGGAADKGLVIVPTELIPDNGTKLRGILHELAERAALGPDFMHWLTT